MNRIIKTSILSVICTVFLTSFAAAQHFQVVRTERNMSLLVREVTINEIPLEVDDEVGVFDPDGVCAGASIIEEPGEAIGLALWGDDPDTDADEGFVQGDAFAYRLWDSETDMEIEAEAEVQQGEGVWVANGFAVISLAGFFEIERHFVEVAITDGNCPILVEEARIDGELAIRFDEVGVFDPDGVCAGAGMFGLDGEEPGLTGFFAWEDDAETELDEGFEEGDAFEFRLWDARHEIEMMAEVEFLEGDNFVENGFIRVNLNSDGVPMPVAPEVEHDFGIFDPVVDEVFEWQAELQNIGNGRFTIVETIGEGDAERFVHEFDREVVLPDETAALNVVFPSEDFEAGERYEMTLMVETDADTTIEYHVTGEIGAARHRIDRAEIYFGTAALRPNNYGVPTQVLDSIMVESVGNGSLLIFPTIAEGSPFFFAENTPEEITLTGGGFVLIYVIFDPDSMGEFEGILNLRTNGVNDPRDVSIPLYGTGGEPISVRDRNVSLPAEFSVAAFPNPFNATATIRFELPVKSEVRISLSDLTGREAGVFTSGVYAVGTHQAVIDGGGLPAGEYLAKIEASGEVRTVRLTLVK